MKHPCRDTAERNGPKAVFCAEIKRIRITISKFLLQGGGQFSINNRSNDMDHLFRREIICVCQHWNRRWLFIVLPIFHPHPVHLPIAFRTKLYASESMDAVVNASVHWNKASQHLRICSVDNGIHRKPRDISLPDRDYTFFYRYIFQCYDSFLPDALL